MRVSLATTLVVCLLAAAAAAQTPSVDPSGHWEGAIALPVGSEIPFEVDLSRNAQGMLVATYSRPDNGSMGLPLANVTLDGRAITFDLTVGDAKFRGVFYADGQTISGDVTAPIGSAPFSMTRTGQARVIAAPKNAPISTAFEGTWNGTLSVDGKNLRLVLRMSNHGDGTSAVTITSVDQGGVEFPLGLTQNASSLTLNSPAIGGDFFAGALNEKGELAGTFSQGPMKTPLTFVRATKDERPETKD